MFHARTIVKGASPLNEVARLAIGKTEEGSKVVIEPAKEREPVNSPSFHL